jgi:hypothetical protein
VTIVNAVGNPVPAAAPPPTWLVEQFGPAAWPAGWEESYD